MGAAIGMRVVANNEVAVVEKRFGGRGSITNGILARDGEVGFQPAVLRGGIHFFKPFQYHLHRSPLVTITQGKIGYVFARDGLSLSPTQGLASNLQTHGFEDVVAFLADGGQRGPQRAILREGTYAFNLMAFIVVTDERVFSMELHRSEREAVAGMRDLIAKRKGFTPLIIDDKEDMCGIITVHDGPSLPQGNIIAPVVGDDHEKPDTYHNNFQDADKFLVAGGYRGRQLQVLTEGTYYINRLFATVELIRKTTVEVGHVGVVVSYTGAEGSVDVSGEAFSHGELVCKGNRGVWNEGLLPGKYAFNKYAGSIIMVPTTNIILKWTRSEAGEHKLDEHLREIALITKDAFEPSLPLSVVIHIDYRKAPMIVQRFGDVKKLVEQTLDPMVAAYFKNIGQTRTLIELIQERNAIQRIASEEMREKFAHYSLDLAEVLIGTPASPPGDTKIEEILVQLRQRQIAEEQVETYGRMQKAAVKERELREAEARAAQQEEITTSELSITVQENQGKAELQRAVQQASQIRELSTAEAEKTARMGVAEAMAIEEKVRAYGGPQYQVTQLVMSRFAEAVEKSGVDLVPRMVINGGGGGGEGNSGGGSANVMEGLMAMLLSDRMQLQVQGADGTGKKRNEQADAIRSTIRGNLARAGGAAIQDAP